MAVICPLAGAKGKSLPNVMWVGSAKASSDGIALAWLSSRADSPGMALCGSTHTDDGTPCENPVRSGERRCWRHGGSRAPSSRQAPHDRSPVPQARGPEPSLGGRASQGGSGFLRRFAVRHLKAKDQIHKLAGELVGDAASVVGVRGAALDFAKELVPNIPLPIDAKTIAVARGVQVAGILLCVMDNRDLTKCECFIDLAKAETKERVDRMLVAAMSDWTNLARFGPQTSRSAS